MVGRIIQINIYNYTIFALCIKFQYSKTLLIQTLIQWNYRYSEVLWGSLQILYKSFYNYLLLLVYPTAFTHKAVLYREVKKPPKFTSHIITQHFIDMILIWSSSYFAGNLSMEDHGHKPAQWLECMMSGSPPPKWYCSTTERKRYLFHNSFAKYLYYLTIQTILTTYWPLTMTFKGHQDYICIICIDYKIIGNTDSWQKYSARAQKE